MLAIAHQKINIARRGREQMGDGRWVTMSYSCARTWALGTSHAGRGSLLTTSLGTTVFPKILLRSRADVGLRGRLR